MQGAKRFIAIAMDSARMASVKPINVDSEVRWIIVWELNSPGDALLPISLQRLLEEIRT